MAVIDTGADAQPAKHASNSLFSRMSISGLIRSGFGLVTALVLVFSIGVYFAMSNVENTFRSMADLSEKREVVNEVFEDLFEARVAGFEYLSSGQQRSLDAVISNLDEIRAMMAQPPGRQSSELTSFEAGADLAAVLSPGLDAFQESLIEFSRLRQQMNSKLSGITSEILSASENIDQISAATVGAGMVSASTALLNLKKSLFVLMNAKAEFVQSGDEADLDRAIQAAVEVEAGLARVVGVLSGSQWVNGLSETTASLDKVNADLADVSRQNTALREFVSLRIAQEPLALQRLVEDQIDGFTQQAASETPQALLLVERAVLISVILGLAVFGLAVCIALLVSGNITANMRKLAETTDRLVADDLAATVPDQHRTDEMGRLARALEKFRTDRIDARARRDAEQTAMSEREAVVDKIKDSLAQLAEGNLQTRIDTVFPEEFEALRDHFNRTCSKLAEALSGVAEQTDGIRSGAENLSSAADELARRTESQAAALEETAATIVQLSQSVSDTAAGATKASDFVSKTKDQAMGSQQIVQATVEAIRNIQSTSNQVSQIIGVIDDIAFQTNLLALNAGVEAARAGDAGQGFAVVASEVRALAQRASTSAKEIKDLIETSVMQVDDGVVKADQTGEALGQIVDMVTEITKLVTTISSETQSQSNGLQEINVAVTQLDEVTQQNAAMVEETSAASQDLMQNSASLARIASAFRTSARDSFRPAPAREIELPVMAEDVLDDEWSAEAKRYFG